MVKAGPSPAHIVWGLQAHFMGNLTAQDTGGDVCFDMFLFPDLPVRVQFWHSDEEFPPKLDIFWDRNSLLFLHYETLWYASGVLRSRLKDAMKL